MKLDSPGANALSFGIIGLVAYDGDGTEDEAKMLTLKNMFHPGRYNEISLVGFVQTCDSLYKRLRYFRASVGNASLIDHVLERIIDDFFAFVLVLLTLTILDINPWPLLVSLSTLLVSFAFAIGPSLSRYIDVSECESGRRLTVESKLTQFLFTPREC
jgi:small-conductance mechanosensitive channel